MKEFDDYLKAKSELFDYFIFNGLAEDIEDWRNHYWAIEDDHICYGSGPINTPNEWNDIGAEYSNHIYNNSIYKGKEYTMFLVNTRFGDKRLKIFSNDKEQKIDG